MIENVSYMKKMTLSQWRFLSQMVVSEVVLRRMGVGIPKLSRNKFKCQHLSTALYFAEEIISEEAIFQTSYAPI